MRVVNHHAVKVKKTKKRHSVGHHTEKVMHAGKRPSKNFIGFVVLLLVAAGVCYYFLNRPSIDSHIALKNPVSSGKKVSKSTATAPITLGALKTFTPDQFKQLYDQVVPTYPNTEPLTTEPVISGNSAADARIFQLAKDRGFTLRSVPVEPIVKTGELNLQSDDLLQPLALQSWRQLKAAAKNQNIPLELLSAYRSIDYQRHLFMERLAGHGGNIEAIAAGNQDGAVNATLDVTAPPGYSRHHTGYTVDLACYPGGRFVAFAGSICDNWIQNNNYESAKSAGWIPSYPKGAALQGPEPEPWEFVWVGAEAVHQHN